MTDAIKKLDHHLDSLTGDHVVLEVLRDLLIEHGLAEAFNARFATAVNENYKERQPARQETAEVTIPVGDYDVYCDGACSGNPGPGGTGFVIVNDRCAAVAEAHEGFEGTTTNQVMELVAATRALNALPTGCCVRVLTDSMYCVGLMSQGWKAKANLAYIASLRQAVARHEVVLFEHIKGHNGHPIQEKCDELARLGVEQSRRRSA